VHVRDSQRFLERGARLVAPSEEVQDAAVVVEHHRA
jgi:hypothetical protein